MKFIQKHPLYFTSLCISGAIFSISVYFQKYLPHSSTGALVASVVTQATGCVLFPLTVAAAINAIKSKRDGDSIWNTVKEFADAGLIRFYQDRERYEEKQDDASRALSNALRSRKKGEVCFVGVSLRVFFNNTGEFNSDIREMIKNQKVKIRVLILDPKSSEHDARNDVEDDETIFSETELSIKGLENIIRQTDGKQVQYRQYGSAPYCTAIIFPDACFYSPNLLSQQVPVRLPLLVFHKRSQAYSVLSDYFEYLWDDNG